MVVFVGHVSGQRFSGGLFWQLGPYMDDAVVVFFVLSGYVISHVVHNKENSATRYFIARAARIYSVAFPALCLTFILDYIGKSLNPASYSSTWGYVDGNVLWQFLSGLFFINQFWFNKVSIGSMLPYWSLGYEVWYYIIFGLLYFGTGSARMLAIGVILLIAGPNIAILLPIWMLGYYSYQSSTYLKIGFNLSIFLFLSSIVFYLLFNTYGRSWIIEIDSAWPILDEKNTLRRYIIAFIFSLNLIGVAGVSTRLKAFPKSAERLIHWLAGATFSIYLFHLPVAQFLTTVFPWSPSSNIEKTLIFSTTFALMLIISVFTERQKAIWSKGIQYVHARALSRLRK